MAAKHFWRAAEVRAVKHSGEERVERAVRDVLREYTEWKQASTGSKPL
jgi:hypothetical protein